MDMVFGMHLTSYMTVTKMMGYTGRLGQSYVSTIVVYVCVFLLIIQ